MAVNRKTVNDYMGLGGLDWKTMGGGGGATPSGLGAIIGGAIAGGSAAAIAGGSAAENKTPNLINPGTGTIPGTEGATPPDPQKNEEKKEPIIAPDIEDKTNENVETSINGSGLDNAFKWAEEQQKELWEREDTIRNEVWAREDSAYQRAVADMRAAGINPNLVGVDPAASGGGITQATGINYEPYQIEMDKYVALLEQEIDNAFKGDENNKDRFVDLLGKFIQTFSFVLMMKKNVK